MSDGAVADPDEEIAAILSDADADRRLGLRAPYALRLREYTALDAGRLVWRPRELVLDPAWDDALDGRRFSMPTGGARRSGRT
jgi:hypothetical protein